ncbi:PDZ and LIM domain protein Zasp isoform X3 [Aethina tumida]|uniref:PDZ and LIM domain protein Zasp isoform X3 n=1 Tax=Aethina tumida TaxID=116153 RepID=UPI002148E819|nr:PDZ and LIM domain protein Zasp isoform X3 [Aethina tumida]
MASLITVRLNKDNSPNWGFRLQGGKDFGTPLIIQKVNSGTPAERAGLIPGDSVIKINNIDVFDLRHKDAQDVVIRAGNNFDMTIQRGGSTWKPSVVPVGTYATHSPSINNLSPVTKTSLHAKPSENIGAIGTGHNLSAKPFSPQLNGSINGGPKLVNKQYNTPLKLYSEESIAETLSAQTEVLSTGALGVNFKKNEKDYDASKSSVYQMLQEAESDPRPNEEPDSGIITTPNSGIAGLRHVSAPIDKPNPPTPQLPPGQNICADCERLIVGVFVRIKDKNLHVECFKCSTCGSSLKNVGYYNINNKLYCDIHAKSAAINNPPAPNLVPVTVQPGGKIPANAISAALATHSLPSPSPLSPKSNSLASPYQSAGFSGPKPFSSVSAPLSPQNTLPRAAPLSPKSPISSAPAPTFSPAPSAECAFETNEKLLQAEIKEINLPLYQESTLEPPNCPPPPPPVPVYNQINITIPYQSTSPHLDSKGSSPRSDYSSYSSSSSKNPSMETAREKILSEIKNITPKLKKVTVSDTQSPKLNYFRDTSDISTKTMTTTTETVTNYNNNTYTPQKPSEGTYKVKTEFTIPINNYSSNEDKKVNNQTNLPDNLTYSNKPNDNQISTHRFNTSATEDVNDYKATGNLPDVPICCQCNTEITRGPFITALGKIWCPEHFICATPSCRRPLQDIGFVEERGQLYCEYCFEQYLAPPCSKCNGKIKGDCLKAIGKNFHPECFNCAYCGKLFGNSPFFLEDGSPYCEADWNELFTTKCFACGFPVEAGDRWVEALNNNYHSQCFNCTMCKKNLEGQSFFAKGGRPFCKNHAR